MGPWTPSRCLQKPTPPFPRSPPTQLHLTIREQEQQALQERSAAAALNQKAQQWLQQVQAHRAQQPQQLQHAQDAQEQQDEVQHNTLEQGEVRQRGKVEVRSEAKRTTEEERQPPLY